MLYTFILLLKGYLFISYFFIQLLVSVKLHILLCMCIDNDYVHFGILEVNKLSGNGVIISDHAVRHTGCAQCKSMPDLINPLAIIGILHHSEVRGKLQEIYIFTF